MSTHLCSFFYADMERRYLRFTAAEDCVSRNDLVSSLALALAEFFSFRSEQMLVRLVDDFLLITTNKDKAVEFVRTMHRGERLFVSLVSPRFPARISQLTMCFHYFQDIRDTDASCQGRRRSSTSSVDWRTRTILS